MSSLVLFLMILGTLMGARFILASPVVSSSTGSSNNNIFNHLSTSSPQEVIVPTFLNYSCLVNENVVLLPGCYANNLYYLYGTGFNTLDTADLVINFLPQFLFANEDYTTYTLSLDSLTVLNDTTIVGLIPENYFGWTYSSVTLVNNGDQTYNLPTFAWNLVPVLSGILQILGLQLDSQSCNEVIQQRLSNCMPSTFLQVIGFNLIYLDNAGYYLNDIGMDTVVLFTNLQRTYNVYQLQVLNGSSNLAGIQTLTFQLPSQAQLQSATGFYEDFGEYVLSFVNNAYILDNPPHIFSPNGSNIIISMVNIDAPVSSSSSGLDIKYSANSGYSVYVEGMGYYFVLSLICLAAMYLFFK